MKIRQAGFITLITILIGLLSSCNNIYDPIAEQAIRTTINQPEGKIAKENFAQIESLELEEVQDLRDLERLPNLKDISIVNSMVKKWDVLYQKPFRKIQLWDNSMGVDVSKLKKESLEEISLKGADIQNITSLQYAPKLNSVTIWNMPDLDFSFLSKLPQLTSLELVGCEITELSFLKDLPNVTRLTLHHNVIENLTPIAEMEHLTELDLHHNHIRDISPIAENSKLKRLNISENRIETIQSIGTMADLIECDISKNHLTEIDELKGLSELQILRMEGNKIRSLQVIEQLPKLIQLFASDNRIEQLPDKIPELLEFIDLESNCVIKVSEFGNAVWNLFDNELNMEEADNLLKTNQVIFCSGDRRLTREEVIDYIQKRNMISVHGANEAEKISSLYKQITSGVETEQGDARQGAYEVIAEKKGNSRSFAWVLQSLLRKEGIDSWIYQGETFSGEGRTHYWNLAAIGIKMAHFDSYCDAGFKGYPDYFGADDIKMGKDHVLLDDYYEPVKDIVGYRDSEKKSVG